VTIIARKQGKDHMTVADSVRVDEAGGRDHQVTPSDAEAHLDGGALGGRIVSAAPSKT
jgi:hypothetical protein